MRGPRSRHLVADTHAGSNLTVACFGDGADGPRRCPEVGEELLAATYGRPGEVRQGGGVDGLNAAVCRGDTIRQNDLNTFIKALSAKASVKFGPTGVNSFREMGAKNKRHYVVTDPG